ncbi:HNH endonuclease [Rhodococcus koreensis]
MNAVERECRRLLMLRCEGRCERCGRWGYTLHHRRKRSQGGLWTASNCVALCGSGTTGCHGWVEANPLAAHEVGLWLRAGEGGDTPLLYRYRMCVLDDTGHVLPT